MTDSADHGSQTVPVSDLTRHLLRRATEPVGAIDVRHAVELHSRSSFGSAQRLELLEGLKHRYGLGQSADAAGHALPVAGGPFTAALQRTAASPFDFAAMSSSPGRDRIAETAMGVISEEPSASSAQHYRVKRPNRYAEPNPVGPLASETVTTRSAAADGIGERPNSIAATRLLRKTDDTQSPAGSGPQASALSPARAADSRPVDQAAPREDGPPAATLPQVGELSRAAVAAPMLLPRMPDGSAETGRSIMRYDLPGSDQSALRREHPSAAGLPQVGELSRAAVAAPMLLQRMPDGSAEMSHSIVRDDLPGSDQSALRREHLSAAALPQVGELPRAAGAAPMPLQRMPDGSAEMGHSVKRDDLAGGDASPLRSPSSIGLSPAGGEIRLSTDSIAAIQLQRATGDTQSLGGSGPEASALPLVRAADTRPGDEPALRDGDPPAAGLPRVSELSLAALAAPMPLQRMPAGSAEIDHSILRDDLPGGDASPLSSPSSIGLPPAGGDIRLGTDSIAATQLQLATGEGQSLAGSGPEAAVLPLMRAAAADNPRRAANEAGSARDGSPGAGAVPHVSELPRSAAVAQLLLQRMPDGSAATSRSTTPDFSPQGDAFPLSGPSPSSARPHPQRNADDPPASAAESPMPMAGTAGAPPHINAQAQFRGAVSAEIRAAPLPGAAGIVWRKAEANGASRASAAPSPAIAPMYANGAQILREAAAEPASSPAATPAPAPAPAPESSGVDVFLIAEQVSRIMTRQLRIERERRGLRR
jgi:hypothetical protein